jgi:uncharacterized membrane protein YjfL (UPF0719 family)
MSDSFGSTLAHNSGAILSYAGLGLVLFVAGFYVVDLATPGRLVTVIRQQRNPNATALATAAMVATGLIVTASIFASGGKLSEGLLSTLVYGVIGIAAQTVAMVVFNLLIGVKVAALCAEERLEPATILLSATYVMIGLVTGISVI